MPIPPGVIRTTCSAILTAVAQRLVDYVVVADASRVIMVARNTAVPHFGAEQDVLLRPMGFAVEKGWDNAAGRVTTVILRRLMVTCRTRDNLDEQGRDKLWLTSATKGHLKFEEATANALHEFWPDLNEGKNFLTIEPMKMQSGDDPDKETKDQSWGKSALVFSMNYLLDLDQSDQ